MNNKLIIKALSLLLALCVTGPLLADPPATSGPNVIRYEDGGAWSFADWDAGIRVVFGADMNEFCAANVNFDLVEIMEVAVSQGPDRIKSLVKGKDVQATVWPFPWFDCYLFTTEEPLAYGTVKLVLTDNDVLSFARDNNNMNAFGLNAQGNMLSTATGEALRLNFVWRAIFRDYNDEDPGNDFYKEILKIDLH